MAASPETAEPQEIADTHPSPPPPSSPVPRPTQESPSETAAASPEMDHLDDATPTPPPPPKHDRVEYSESGESPVPPCAVDPPPSFPPLEAAPAASAALEATSPEKPASPSPCPPDAPVEVSLDVTDSAASPLPSPQIEEASPVDATPTLSPPLTPPATASRASPDSSAAEAVAMASQEAAPLPPAPGSDSHTAPAPLTPPLESGPEGLSRQQQPPPPAPEMTPQVCPPPPAESIYALPGATADEVVAMTSEESAGSPPALEATDGETDTGPDVPPALESGVFPHQQPRPPGPEMSPPRCENSEPAKSAPPPAESTNGLLEAAANEVAAVASEEAAGSPPALEIPLQEPVQISSSPIVEAEPCSPEMAPPGFENFKSKWLPVPPPTPPAESTPSLVEASATNPVGMMAETTAGSLPALEAMDVEMDISPGLLPSLKSAEEGPLQQLLRGSSSVTMEVAPCSPDMPPPGFENFKPSSWLMQPTLPPSAGTAYSPDVATTKGVALAEKASSVPALEATNADPNTARNLLTTLESGAGGSLQVPLPRPPYPTTQVAPCLPCMAPPGFENLKLQQLQLPSPPLSQTSYILQDSAAMGAMNVVATEEAPQPSSLALEAMDVEMDDAPAVPTPGESGARESLRQEPLRLPYCTVQDTGCSLEMVPSGSENLESSQLLPPPAILPLVQTPDALADAVNTTVTVEKVCHPPSVAEATEDTKGSILPPPLENGCEGPLPCLQPQASSPVVQAAPSSPEITPTGFESLESSQQTSPRLAERIDSSSNVPATKSVTVKSEKMPQPLSLLQAIDTDMESATVRQSPSKSKERSLPQLQHQPSSPSVKDAPCSPDVVPPGYGNLDSLEQLPLPPPLCTKFELGQMVCGCCRELLAYPRGAIHVQCFGCTTINLVLEAHQVGKVYCGQCETLLMYPHGSPAVRCSTCLFVTEIGERNVRPRISMEQSVSPHPQELTHQS